MSKPASNNFDEAPHGELQRRPPLAVHPQEHRVHQLPRQLLAHKAPHAHAAQGHADAHRAARQRGDERHLGLCLEVDGLDEQRPRDDGQGVDYQNPADDAHHVPEQRLLEEGGYPRRADVKHGVEHRAHPEVEEEHRAVVHPAGILLADERVGKAAVHNGGGDGDEDGYHRHDAILGRGEQAGQHQTDQERYPRVGDVVHEAPAYTLDGLVL